MSVPSLARVFAMPLLTLALAIGGCTRSDSASAAGKGGDGTRQMGGRAMSAADFAALRNFDRVSLHGPDNVEVSTGKEFAVRAEGDPRALEALEVKVEDGELRVSRREGWHGFWGSIEGDRGATVHVSMPLLRAASLTGSGELKVDMVKGEAFTAALAGSGDLSVGQLAVANLSASIGGSGDMVLAGRATSARLSTTGSGDLSARNLKADRADINVTGSGDIAVASDGYANVSIVGSGDVDIKGKARCNVSALGSGSANCHA